MESPDEAHSVGVDRAELCVFCSLCVAEASTLPSLCVCFRTLPEDAAASAPVCIMALTNLED